MLHKFPVIIFIFEDFPSYPLTIKKMNHLHTKLLVHVVPIDKGDNFHPPIVHFAYRYELSFSFSLSNLVGVSRKAEDAYPTGAPGF